MCPSASQWVAPCTHRLSVSSAYLILFQSCRPAMASVPVASIWWIGLKRPPNRPVCGPLLSSGMPSANTLPVRMRLAALTISSGLTWLSVPIWSSLPQRPQFLSFCVASAIACLPTLMSIGRSFPCPFHDRARRADRTRRRPGRQHADCDLSDALRLFGKMHYHSYRACRIRCASDRLSRHEEGKLSVRKAPIVDLNLEETTLRKLRQRATLQRHRSHTPYSGITRIQD